MNEGAARVLAALRRPEGSPCSGAVLSQRLGVTRAQIWKHVEALRALGYAIEGEPGGGYRLIAAPDRLYPEEIEPLLHTSWLARSIHWHETLDSTNRLAFELAGRGAPHGTCVIAEGQSAGRGRLGRSFYSPPFLNLYTTLVLRPILSTAEAPTTILTAAIGVADTVAAVCERPDAVEIKWPNDVLADGLKVSGILMEMAAEGSRVGFLLLGIGVNLNVDPAGFPEEFRGRATSLRAHTGRPVQRAAFAARLYDTLEALLDRHAEGGFAAVRERFEARFRMGGQEVRVVDVGGAETRGHVLGIDEDGALCLRQRGGDAVRIVSGDVTLTHGRAAP